MSIFFPYDLSTTISYFADLFTIDVSSLTPFEELCLTILGNLYFFLFWFIILYFTIKLFNRVWERVF